MRPLLREKNFVMIYLKSNALLNLLHPLSVKTNVYTLSYCYLFLLDLKSLIHLLYILISGVQQGTKGQ